jgi:nucleoside recognition membrane protein YjiH
VTPRSLLKFLLPSTLGCLLFLVPITYAGKTSIGLDFLLNWFRIPFRGYELPLIVSIVLCSAVGSGYFLIRKPECRDSHPTLYGMFQVAPRWCQRRQWVLY